jgi:hypothetical protein
MNKVERLAVAAYVAPRIRSPEEGRKIKVVGKDGAVVREISQRELTQKIAERAEIELTIVLEPDMCVNFAKGPDGGVGCRKRLNANTMRARARRGAHDQPECRACRRRRERDARIDLRCQDCGVAVSRNAKTKRCLKCSANTPDFRERVSSRNRKRAADMSPEELQAVVLRLQSGLTPETRKRQGRTLSNKWKQKRVTEDN